MNSSKQTISLLGLSSIIGFALLSFNSFAQNGANNMPNSNSFLAQNPSNCASTCSATRGCASWKFTPYPAENGISRGGICEFSQTPISPNRPMQSQNNVQQMPDWGAPRQRTGGNYQVTPLNVPAPAPRQTYAPPPQGVAQPQNQGGTVTFERPQTPKPAPTYNAPTYNAPQYSQAPVYQAPVNQVPAPQYTPAPTPQYTPAPQPVYQAPANNLNQYRAADGTIDAAEMRRNQIKTQTNQTAPRYSVQSEWNEVARAEANGQNQPYDLSNTTPVPYANSNYSNDNQEMAQTEPKRRLFGLLPPKTIKTEKVKNEAPESARPSALHGPLRKRNN